MAILYTGPSFRIQLPKGFEIDSDGNIGCFCIPVKKLWSSGGQHFNSKNSKNRVNDTQVTQPLEKTKEEEEVEQEGNRGGHYETGIPATFTKPLRKARSKVFPPDFSEADLQERWSLRSSISGARSVFGSQTSISTFTSKSSGYGSLASIPESSGSSEPKQRKLPVFLRKIGNVKDNAAT